MRFYDLLVAKEKGTFTAHGGLWASLLQGDQPCLVPEPAPIEAGQFSPHPPAVGASFWLCAGVPGPRLLPLIVRSLCSACPLCPTPWATARPHPDRCFYDLSFSESPAWRSRSSISEPSVFPSAAAAMLWPSMQVSAQGSGGRGPKPSTFTPSSPVSFVWFSRPQRTGLSPTRATSFFLGQRPPCLLP